MNYKHLCKRAGEWLSLNGRSFEYHLKSTLNHCLNFLRLIMYVFR